MLRVRFRRWLLCNSITVGGDESSERCDFAAFGFGVGASSRLRLVPIFAVVDSFSLCGTAGADAKNVNVRRADGVPLSELWTEPLEHEGVYRIQTEQR